MASAFITNALQVNFDSVLGISDNDEMVNMFKALESTGLRDFLGCPSILYEQKLEQFFDTALVQNEGLTDLSEVPNNLVFQARNLFSKSSVPVQFSCKKRLMKYEFRLLNDILAKSITVKAGSFDAVTHERFLMMTAIHFGIKVNCSKILFEVLKEMVDRTTKRAKGFAAQICALLKNDPAVTLGEAKTFPPLKIISAKTESEPLSKVLETSVSPTSDDESLSLEEHLAQIPDGMMLPSLTAAEPTKIKFCCGIEIRGVEAGDWYKANLPKIAATDKGKKPLEEPDTVKGHSAQTSANQIDFLVDTSIDGETPVTQISLPAVDTTDVTEYFSQLRASITRLSVNQLKTSSKIGDLQNHILLKIENLEKAFKEALTNQEHVHRIIIHSAQQETQNQKAALSLEMLKYQKEVRAQHAVMITDLTDIRSQIPEIQALKKDFTDFQQKTESGIAHVSSQLSEIITYINRGGNDKKGEVGNSHGRGQPPLGDGGSCGSRSEPSRKKEAVDLSRESGDIGFLAGSG
ncbi:P-ATPase family transporter: calcium ion [Dorcoceras hygrometricum]|uniref:P-ATPase family transporter: calcium ion n=1 Tax=Dorcoceras hygrometricum TaxID=472368 RepID=A0A2Z7A9S2_9LAMI|nr:P-ATPase family transporter: calcium ion [Dorcoceras hygrometricum]